MIKNVETSLTQTKKRNSSVGLKKSLKQQHHGSGLGNPVETFDKITSSVSNFADKLSNLLLGGPPDIRIASIPYTDIYGDNASNMTNESRDIFLNKKIGTSQQGNLFRKRLEAYEENNTSSEWKYNITKGQLKNFAENFCQERKDLFEDQDKKEIFNLPDDDVAFDKPKKCYKKGKDEDNDSEKEDDNQEESTEDEEEN